MVTDLTPNKTVRLENKDISNKGEFKWPDGRGVLTIESNISDGKLQVYLLLRAKNPGGGAGSAETPILNMSTGATGNSCD